MKILLVTVVLCVLSFTAPNPGAYAQSQGMSKAATFNLSAHGVVRVMPDMATVSVGVINEAPTAAEAMRENAGRMSEVTAVLGKHGVEARHVQTSNVSLHPQYTYRENQPPLMRGYQAQNIVTIRVMTLDRLGRIIDAVVASGSNQIQGISFGLAEPLEAENSARREAVKALRNKAEVYAEATGQRIGRLAKLTESGGYSPEPPRPMSLSKQIESMDISTPISAGQLEVRIDIRGVYELAR